MKRIFSLKNGTTMLAVLALAACGGGADEPVETPDAGATSADTPEVTEVDVLGDIMTAPWRDEDRARDAFRNPQETLEFFGLEPGMSVAEIWPGRGWYTRILAPYAARTDGQLYVVLFSTEGLEGERLERVTASNQSFKDSFANEELFGTPIYTEASGSYADIAPDGSLDLIVTFRNTHSWMGGGFAEDMFAEFYDALKPGGTLGLVQHRLPETAEQDPTASSGYVMQDYVIQMAEEAGFEFAGASEVNANPLDTADHPFGVWTLPPVGRTEGRDGTVPDGFDPASYQAIGESDRMTLKFVKPMTDMSDEPIMYEGEE